MELELRVGVIKEVLPEEGRAIVNFPQYDEQESMELPVLQLNTLKNKHFHLPDVDEQVYVLMDENAEDGCILGAIYSEADPPSQTEADVYAIEFEDKTAVKYDRKVHLMTVKMADETELSYDGENHALKIKVTSGGSVEIEAEGPVSVSSDKAMIFKAAQSIALESPQIALNTAALSCAAPPSEDGSEQKLSAVFQGDFKIYGDDFILQAENAEIMSPLVVNSSGIYTSGSIYADGTITDEGGNSNHHEHPQYQLR